MSLFTSLGPNRENRLMNGSICETISIVFKCLRSHPPLAIQSGGLRVDSRVAPSSSYESRGAGPLTLGSLLVLENLRLRGSRANHDRLPPEALANRFCCNAIQVSFTRYSCIMKNL